MDWIKDIDWGDVISQSAQSNLGVIALAIIVLSILVFALFRGAGNHYPKLGALGLLIIGILSMIFIMKEEFLIQQDQFATENRKAAIGGVQNDIGWDESCKNELSNSCGKGVCVSFRLPNMGNDGDLKELECDLQCIAKLEQAMLKNNISYNSPSGGVGDDHTKCVGYRSDIRGTYKGALCLAELMGQDFKVGNCNHDGFPYNIFAY